jgi:hypothetical protein
MDEDSEHPHDEQYRRKKHIESEVHVTQQKWHKAEHLIPAIVNLYNQTRREMNQEEHQGYDAACA